MKGLLTVLTDGAYKVKSFATDAEGHSVCAYSVFTGTHLAGGPCPPTGRTTWTDHVYVMQFEGAKISHMTKIWHSGLAMEELGWGDWGRSLKSAGYAPRIARSSRVNSLFSTIRKSALPLERSAHKFPISCFSLASSAVARNAPLYSTTRYRPSANMAMKSG